jgi:hypothetical protein
LDRNVLTIAIGQKIYSDFAINLARSFFWHHPASNIAFYIVTDKVKYIPQDIINKVKIIKVKTDELPAGFSSKLYLDKLAPEGQTLFIDSDCLIFGNLDGVFEKFMGHPVSVIGSYIYKGEWFGNVEQICKKFNLLYYPKFNGGIYYLEKGDIASSVYKTARELEKKYDEIGFVRLRNKPNDEVIMAVAMQLFNQKPICEDGSILGEFVNFKSGVDVNIFTGKALLYNKPGHKNFQSNWPLYLGKPLVVHFLGDYTSRYPYTTEIIKLELQKTNLPFIVINIYAYLFSTLPWHFKFYFKQLLRPIYSFFFGTRSIKKSERIID